MSQKLCQDTANRFKELKKNPTNINVTPSSGDGITRFVLRVMNQANVGAATDNNVGSTITSTAQTITEAAGPGTNGVSVQEANRELARIFLGASPLYTNRSDNPQCYEPPQPNYSRYGEILSRQAAMRYVFAACAANDADFKKEFLKLANPTNPDGPVGPRHWYAASLPSLGSLVKFPPEPQETKVADNPPVSFLLVGNDKPQYMLTGTNAGKLVQCLKAWGDVGPVKNFYTLNCPDAAVAGAITLNHTPPDSLPRTRMTSLARAIDVIRHVAAVERYRGNILVVVNVQSGFWYHTQYSGTPTLTLTPNTIPGTPGDPNTALDAELERCHVHLSVRCSVPTLLSGGTAALSQTESKAIHDGLRGLRRCHPAFAPCP